MILGKFTKQPLEVEAYAIQFAEDMTATDELTGNWHVLTHYNGVTAALVKASPYTVTASDNGASIRTNSEVTLPAGLPDGFVSYIGNTSQSDSIVVNAPGPIFLPARAAIILVRTAGEWVVEASSQSVLVSAPGDQRVRAFVTGGKDGAVYKAEITATSAEGRVMQDEFIVKIKEY